MSEPDDATPVKRAFPLSSGVEQKKQTELLEAILEELKAISNKLDN